jgi:adenylate cyclase, class 2
MYEVEVKAALRNRNEVIQNLINLGCEFSEELHQVDYVFFPKGFSFPPPIGTAVLRVRNQNDKYFFTLKMSQSNRQDSIEREMSIGDGPMMIEILKLMGWQEAPTVDKRRNKTNFKDMEIVLDHVEELGEFIEVEKVVKNENEGERNKIQSELFAFLETLGIKKEDQVIDGKYDIMLWEKMGGKS